MTQLIRGDRTIKNQLHISGTNQMPKSNDTKLHLETYRTLNYALPTVVVAFLIGPVAIIQGIYAKYFGLSLTTIASVLLIARLFDAVTDPLIGYFSDHYYARTGSRKKIICTGAVLFIISAYFLYVPHGIGSSAPYDPISTACFLTWFLIFYLGWTMFEIPHLAWGSELAVGAGVGQAMNHTADEKAGGVGKPSL